MDCPVTSYAKNRGKSRRRHERPLWPVGAVARGGEGVAPLLGDQLVHREVEGHAYVGAPQTTVVFAGALCRFTYASAVARRRLASPALQFTITSA